MKIYGLTGGSGAGKSAAAALLTQRGFGWVDADAVYRGLCVPGSALIRALHRAFGDILTPEGALDRPKLSQIVFSDPARLKQLNDITRPHIWQASEEEFHKLAEQGIGRILYDAPTLFQAGLDGACDAVIGVVARRETRIARIMARDGLTEDAAKARIDAQPDSAFYCARCDFVLDNDGSLDDLKAQVDALCRRLDGPQGRG